MMKFFRKYTKHLLAVFMALLLVVWLGGSALTTWLTPERVDLDEPVAKMFGKTVTYGERLEIASELETLQNLNMRDWQFIWYGALMDVGVPGAFFGKIGEVIRPDLQPMGRGQMSQPLKEEEWFMLAHEARHHNVFAPLEAVEQVMSDRGLTGAILNRIRQHRSTEQIDKAIQSFLQVKQLFVVQEIQLVWRSYRFNRGMFYGHTPSPKFSES